MRGILLPVLLVFLIPVGFSFEVSVSGVFPVTAGYTGNFTVKIKNTGEDAWFSLSVLGTKSSWLTLEATNVFVKKNGVKEVTVWVSPPYDAFEFNYIFTVIVSKNGERKEIKVSVPVKQKLTAAVTELRVCNPCEPGKSYTAKVVVSNLGSRTVYNARVIFESPGLKVQKTADIGTLERGEKREVYFEFQVPERALPGKIEFSASVFSGENVLHTKTAKSRVPEVKEIKRSVSEKPSLFWKTVTLTVTNLGNLPEEIVVEAKKPEWFEFYTGPEHTGYSWKLQLLPGETKRIEYTLVYWPVVVFAVLLLAGFFLYMYFESTVRIAKRIVKTRGGVSISLEIKNGRKPVERVTVVDFVPSIFEVDKKFETKKPYVKKTEEGTRLTWRVGKLKPHEERVLHYRIKPVIGIIGEVKLPKARVTAECGEKRLVSLSNSLKIRGASEK
ncbi:MAG: hypothetical protein GXO63_00960 [Candidatus Micrarchaeota archaeon]|nr:hypothetical protein [Candidatus Micrarchaeota archaeon]